MRWRLALLTALILLLTQRIGYAQGKYSVNVRVVDTDSGEPIEFATVSVRESGRLGTKKITPKYCLSDKEGNAAIQKVNPGQWVLKTELLGYETDSVIFKVEGKDVDLGNIFMRQVKEVLEAATVTAVGNPVVFKKDTVEYNAKSFLMTENDLLEDLLKKLPGVEVDDDGNVTVNGEIVKKITIEGKTFFLNDPKLATKNIPARYIKKLKVIEKKSEQAEFTGIDDGERETVLDLSVEESMMKGTFGNLMGGLGHDLPGKYSSEDDFRYQGSAFAGKFTKKRQTSVVFNVNNTNNRAATDLSGRMMQEGRGGGGGNGGISTNLMAGANGAWNFFDDKMDFSSNYVYTHGKNDSNAISDRTTYLGDSNLDYHSESKSHNSSDGHRIGLRVNHKFSEKASILFEPELNFGHGSYNDVSTFNTIRESADTTRHTNEGSRSNFGTNDNVSTNGSLLYRQRLGIPGRTFSMRFGYSFRHNDTDGKNQSLNRTFRNDGTQKDSILDQTVERNSKNSSLSGRLSYTEPLGRGFYIEGNYSLNWGRNTSRKDTYDADGNYDVAYSNNILNEYINQKAGTNLRYQQGKTRWQVGVSMNPTRTTNQTMRRGVETAYKNNVTNWSPQASFSSEIDSMTSVRFSYFGSSHQPSTSQLMPVPDVSNPLRVTMGNPYLIPYFSNAFNLRLRHSNKKTFLSYSLNISGNYVANPIVNALCYSNDGVQYSMPVNDKNNWNGNADFTINTPIGKSHFSFSNTFSSSYNTHGSYIASDMDMSPYYASDTKEFDYEKFHQDFKDINSTSEFTRNKTQTMNISERMRLNYRIDDLEVQLLGRTRMNKSWYTITSNKKATWTNSASCSVTYNWKALGLAFDTQFQYRWYDGFTTPRDNEGIWNARISKMLFKDKITLAVRAYDILCEETALSVSDSSNQHRETLNTTLGRYVIGTLTYRFGKRFRHR